MTIFLKLTELFLGFKTNTAVRRVYNRGRAVTEVNESETHQSKLENHLDIQ